MLSRRQWGLSVAALLFALSVPATAQGPVDSICNDMRADIDYYHGLWLKGGTPKQMEVWRKIYVRNVWRYGNARCPKYIPKRRKALAGKPKAAKPALITERRATTAEEEQQPL